MPNYLMINAALLDPDAMNPNIVSHLYQLTSHFRFKLGIYVSQESPKLERRIVEEYRVKLSNALSRTDMPVTIDAIVYFSSQRCPDQLGFFKSDKNKLGSLIGVLAKNLGSRPGSVDRTIILDPDVRDAYAFPGYQLYSIGEKLGQHCSLERALLFIIEQTYESPLRRLAEARAVEAVESGSNMRYN